jgi:hypothetical protein
MAILAVTSAADVLGQLPGTVTFPLAILRATVADNGDGTRRVTAETTEDNIPALTALGCTVQVIVTDADQLARAQVIQSQTDDQLPIA